MSITPCHFYLMSETQLSNCPYEVGSTLVPTVPKIFLKIFDVAYLLKQIQQHNYHNTIIITYKKLK